MATIFTKLCQIISLKTDENPLPYSGSMELDPLLPEPGIKWSEDEIDIALHCERNKSTCAILSLPDKRRFQTLMLGVDLHNNLLLVDDLFPAKQLSPQSKFELTLTAPFGSLRLTVCFQETVEIQNCPALLMKVLNKSIEHKPKAHAATQFNCLPQPKIKVVLPLTGTLRGSVQEISLEDVCINVVSKDNNNWSRLVGDCCIEFTPSLILRLPVQIKAIKHRRKPYNHFMVRLAFCDLTDDQTQQLDNFIKAHRRKAKIASECVNEQY